MEILFQIFSIIFLGIIAASIPGPILTSVFTEVFRKGFLKSLKVVFMALISEVAVATPILVLFSFADIPQSYFYTISFVGAGVLIWMAWQVWRIKELGGGGEIFSFWKIFSLTVFNGPFWIFWLTICVPQGFLLKDRIPHGQFLFLAFFELGWIMATVFWAFFFSRFRNFLIKNNFVPIVFKFFALALFFFSIKSVVESVIFLSNNF